MGAQDGSTAPSVLLSPAGLHFRKIFLHFFDIHFLDERGEVARSRAAFAEMDLAVRFAVVMAHRILVPAASYYENPEARRVLEPYVTSSMSGLFTFVGSGSSYLDFADEKLSQYARGSMQHEAYRVPVELDMPWRRRERSATKDIKRAWTERADAGSMIEVFDPRLLTGSEEALASAWESVPDDLGDAAFIVENVAPLLPVKQGIVVNNRLHAMINADYFASFTGELGASVFQDLVLLGSPNVPSGNPVDDIRYDMLVKACRIEAVLDDILNAKPERLEFYRNDERFVRAFGATQTAGSLKSEHDVDRPLTVKSNMKPTADLAIITPLPKEREAVEAVFGKSDPIKFHDDNHIYRQISTRIAGRSCRIIVATLSDMGNANAATVTSNLARSVDFPLAAMIGIAGGVPTPENLETHVRLGDVVISSALVEYDRQKKTEKGVQRRDHPQRVGHIWTQATTTLRTGKTGFDERWRALARAALKRLALEAPDATQDVLHDYDGEVVVHPDDARRKNGNLVHVGTIGSGDTLLKDPVLRDEVATEFNARAIEMESAGFREALWPATGTQLVVVRGVVDYCDSFKSDDWHVSAAVSAASVCKLLFSEIARARLNGTQT